MIKNDFNKIAKLTKDELEEFLLQCKLIGQKNKEYGKPDWTQSGHEYQNMSDDLTNVLVTLGQKFYIDGAKHDSTLYYGSVMRRNLRLNESDVLMIIETLDPGDTKNYETVKDIFKQEISKCANIITLRNHIAKVTDERTAQNIVKELKSLEPHDNEDGFRQSDAGPDEDKPKPAAILMELAIKNIEECFKDQDDNYHAMIYDKEYDSHPIVNLNSDEIYYFLSRLYREEKYGTELARKDWLALVIENLKAITKRSVTLYDRFVWLDDTYYYNLNNAKGEIIKVTVDVKTTVKQSPDLILFRQLPDDHEQIAPDFNLEIGEDGEVRDYLQDFVDTFHFEDNENDKHTLILKCYIPTLFLNAAAFPIHVATGDEGGTKTTFQRMIKSLLDPTENKNGQKIEDKILGLTTTLDIDPEHMWERFLTIHQNHYSCFDNVDQIPRNVFDELCMAVTGYKVPRRILYKTDKLMYLNIYIGISL